MKTYPLRIAWRYLWARKSHSVVSVIAAVSIIGVAVATAAIVCVLSVFNGFQEVLSSKLDTLSPQLSVQPTSGKVFANADSLASALNHIEGIDIATPTVTDNALAIYSTHEMPVTLKGVVPEEYDKVTDIRSILKGESEYIEALSPASRPGALLSIGSASQLGAHTLGESLLIFAPRREGRVNMANPANSFLRDSVTFSGYFQSQHSQFDQDLIIVPIEVARDLFQYDSEASAVELRLKSGADITATAEKVRLAAGPGAIVKDRLQQQEINFRMIKIEKWVTFLLLFFILLIASFNLISTLSMLVLEKQKSLRTLRNLGATPSATASIFRWESLLVALLGGISGLILGIGLCLMQQHFGLIRLNGDPSAMIIDTYPVKVVMTDLVAAIVPVVVIGLFTGWIAGRFARSRSTG